MSTDHMATIDAKNLAMIQRIDVCAEAILDKATHTALYNFNSPAKMWEKTEVDGAMFIYKRVDHPHYSLMIANRQSPQDLIEPILANIRLKLDKPYIFFCKADETIRGLWFYKEEECIRIYNLMETIIANQKNLAALSQSDPKAPSAISAVPIVRQPVAMAPTTVSLAPAPPTSGGLLSLLMGGTSVNSAASPSGANALNPPLVAAVSAMERPISEQNTEILPNMLQKLMLEQSATVKQENHPQQQQQQQTSAVSAAVLERHFLLQQNTTTPGHTPLHGHFETGAGAVVGVTPAIRKDLALSSQERSMLPSASGASLAALSMRSTHGSETDVNELDSVMACPTGTCGGEERARDEEVEGSDSGRSGDGLSSAPPPGLDKHQLAAALLHLLNNDDEFLFKVHQAYTEALNRRLNL